MQRERRSAGPWAGEDTSIRRLGRRSGEPLGGCVWEEDCHRQLGPAAASDEQADARGIDAAECGLDRVDRMDAEPHQLP